MMMWLRCFYDPVLRGPTIGSMLMCFVAALVGVLLFVRKRSLLGEALSHATYPGVTGAIVVASFFSQGTFFPIYILLGAALSSLIGYFLIDYLVRKVRVSDDAALCFVLSFFFGIGILIASYAQNSHTALYRQIQVYLYGQAATMSDLNILIYGILACLVGITIFLFYKELLSICFDHVFATASGISIRLVQTLFTLLVVVAVVIGIRSVGVILMSAMLIAPAAAARQFTNRLSLMFVLSALFGVLSGYIGTYLSLVIPGMPTGPMIVLVAGATSLYALLFAPQRGLMIRGWRVAHFRKEQMLENLLKSMWYHTHGGEKTLLAEGLSFSKWLLFRLRMRGYLKKKGKTYYLTPLGVKKGGQIVRLHRLWEVYLVNSLGLGVQRVHTSAEQMEHILTPELERQLTELLDDPKQDPHQQPIPPHEEVMQHV